MDDDPFRAGMVKPNLFHNLKILSLSTLGQSFRDVVLYPLS